MGLLDFVKDAGTKIFNWEDDDAKLATQVEEQVTKMGMKVSDLSVKCENDCVTLEGKVPNPEEKEKISLLVGNSQGVSKVVNNLTVEQQGTTAESKFHTVKSGDTLSKIAKEQYGDASKYPTIFEANKPLLKNPDDIFPGQVLRIPELS